MCGYEKKKKLFILHIIFLEILTNIVKILIFEIIQSRKENFFPKRNLKKKKNLLCFAHRLFQRSGIVIVDLMIVK